ncbi:hypothetical protein JCM19240_4996 [Vibrio maritimus]|uniref:Porin n=1 Tax=Vibrio maritimus TaxID=990268 RepID=A0A090SUZ0_9VIBR|nr:hypothetical protein JCM19240_4996 [Vibrio maritimus]
MKKTLAVALLLPASQLCALEIQDYVSLNGLVGAYQTNGGPLVEGSKEGNPIEAKVRANLTANVPITEDWSVFGRMEYDLNFLNLKEGTEIKNGKLRKRYEYVGVEHSYLGALWFGKDWGANYSHLPILKMAYLGFQDVAAAQATWRNSDTLLYKIHMKSGHLSHPPSCLNLNRALITAMTHSRRTAQHSLLPTAHLPSLVMALGSVTPFTTLAYTGLVVSYTKTKVMQPTTLG